MARLLALERVGDESWDEILRHTEKLPAPPPGPLWNRFKQDARWKTDLWIRRADTVKKPAPKI